MFFLSSPAGLVFWSCYNIAEFRSGQPGFGQPFLLQNIILTFAPLSRLRIWQYIKGFHIIPSTAYRNWKVQYLLLLNMFRIWHYTYWHTTVESWGFHAFPPRELKPLCLCPWIHWSCTLLKWIHHFVTTYVMDTDKILDYIYVHHKQDKLKHYITVIGMVSNTPEFI
jgi:hypothetical protein